MRDIKFILEQQAVWQRDRAKQSWAEKLRQAVILREAQRQLRAPKCSAPSSAGPRK